jgi:hypothetical protein
MDITYYNDGNHSGSGLGSSDNGPVPLPGPVGQAAYDVATSNSGNEIEPDTKIDGGQVGSFDPNGATNEVGGANKGSAPSPDSIQQPDSGQKYPTGSSYPS